MRDLIREAAAVIAKTALGLAVWIALAAAIGLVIGLIWIALT